ncbi:glycosyl hydrolase [Sphingomonas sp. PAMC 26605]|uniref:glycosyl hydrolase n=1 Tax=Sphingomonas sp. PAMC 26605 TaxID=1112214 RepID=UPI00026CC596|nr:glycosyl hydrolase [Sphingomonas sp. PAMC 26605]
MELHAQPHADPLLEGFRDPPNAARPRVWWHWMNGNVTKDGIRRDLEWMKRVKIGGMTMFNGNLDTPRVVDHPVTFMSPEWKDAIRYTAEQSARLGLEFTIASSDGWSLTGGPWVTPERAMKKLVWSETEVRGGTHVRAALAPPPVTSRPYQDYPYLEYFGNAVSTKPIVAPHYEDISVVAYKRPSRGPRVAARITANAALLSTALLSDGAYSSNQTIRASADGGAIIRIEYPNAVTKRAIVIGVAGAFPHGRVEAEASDGRFTKVAEIDADPPGDVFGALPARTIAFPSAVTSSRFRLVLEPTKSGAEPTRTYALSEMVLTDEARVNRFEAKAAFDSLVDYDRAATPPGDRQGEIDPASIVDLTAKMDASGHLDWQAPKGDWVVLRLGASLTGHRNSPATREGTGLEVDKLDATAVRGYLASFYDPILAAVGDYKGHDGLQAILTDSYEAGQQNWSPRLFEEFRTRRGYDPRPWIPVLTGRVVSSAQASDRFLADYRQTIVDLFADAHYRTIAAYAHEHGLRYYAESMAGFRPFAGNDIRNRSFGDVPMGEFWAGGVDPRLIADVVGAASIAHVYGQNIVAAESFTYAPNTEHPPFSAVPGDLQPQVDAMFAEGLNRVVVHTSVHQPDERAPGMTLGPYGQYFTRHETWGEQAGAWMTYIARSSYLLQQGLAVRDVLCLLGDGVRVGPQKGDDPVPTGFGMDCVDQQGFLDLVDFENGRIRTRSGMTYGLLKLGVGTERLDPRVMAKIRDLVAKGATLVGPKPTGTRGLTAPDRATLDIADLLWGPQGQGRRYGRGQVLTGPLPQALQISGIAPDFSSAADLRFYHRRLDAGDIYFVTNPSARPVSTTGTFRTSGHDVEYWNADTGSATPASFDDDGAMTRVPLNLAAGASTFVVFRGHPSAHLRVLSPDTEPDLATIARLWSVRFLHPGRPASTIILPALTSWSDSSDAAVRFFSGTAIYSTTFDLDRRSGTVSLDLGRVGDVATVRINGELAGTAWKAPYRLDVGRFLRTGRNSLEIEVANTWLNRIIGMKRGIPDAAFFTTAPTDTITAHTELRPSGLLGPVRLIETQRAQ